MAPAGGRYGERALLATAAVAAVGGVVGAVRAGPNGDSAWILYAAGRMLDGQRLYADLVEMNPPLVFWATLPVARLARSLGLDPWMVLVAAVLACCTAAGALLLRVFAAGAVADTAKASETSRGRSVLVSAFVLTALALPVGWFAQREHLMLVLLWPLLGVAMARSDGRPVFAWVAAAAGALAALGLALKPPAVIVWPVLAALVALRRRNLRALVAPEHMVLALGLVGYAVAALVLTPEFVPAMRRLAPLYLHFSTQPLSALLLGDVLTWTVWAGLACWIAAGPRGVSTSGQPVLAAAALAFLAAAVLQGKGFGYHYYPAFGCAVALLLVIAAHRGPAPEEAQGTRPAARRIAGAARRIAATAALAAMAVLFVPVLLSRAAGTPQRRDAERAELARIVRDVVPPGGSLIVLSPRLGDAFPLVSETDTRLALRYPHLWWMAAMDALRRRGDTARVAEFAPLDAELRRSVAQDLTAHRPRLILARNPDPSDRYAGDAPVDPVRYLLIEPGFAAALSNYVPAGRVAGFDLYRLPGAGQAPVR